MRRIADQLAELIQRMEESDRHLKRLIDEVIVKRLIDDRVVKRLIDDHVESTSQHLEELKRLNKE